MDGLPWSKSSAIEGRGELGLEVWKCVAFEAFDLTSEISHRKLLPLSESICHEDIRVLSAIRAF